MAVLVVAADNASTGGAAFTTFKVTDDQGNVWTRRVTPLYDPGAAEAGVTGAQFTTDMAGGTILSSTVLTVTFDTATTAKAWAMWEVIPDSASKNIIYIASGVNAGAATASPTVTTSSITSGDVVIGGLHNEYGTAQTVTGDADATNGAWSSQQTDEVGTTAAGMSVSSQYKVVTGTATQTYNPTLGTSSDVILSWMQLRQVPFLQVGAVDQTAYVLLESMNLRFNSFDFSLKNPATTPANGDTVTLGGPPYWTGTVVSVETIDYTNAYKRVNITASNTDVGVASAAPFGLSDAPNNTTTFMFRDMSVRVQTNIDDATQTTTGSCTTTQAGLWPAMTFELTSANRGYSAQSFSVTDVTVTWPKKDSPLFRIGFGDPIVTMSVWVASQAANAPVGSIDGTRITDGSISTPKLAANAVTADKIAANTITGNEISTALLIDGTIEFTGGQFLRGDGVGNLLQIDTDGASAPTGVRMIATSGQFNYLSMKVSGDGFPRLGLRGDATLTALGMGGATVDVDVWIRRSAARTLTFDDDGAGGGLNAVSIPDAKLRLGGTSFPASPATDDLFYRTDLDLWFFYNGTRWLSATVFDRPLVIWDVTNQQPYAATSAVTHVTATPALSGGSDIWLETSRVGFYVNGGGSALSASHKWVGVVQKSSGATNTTIATHTLDSGASSSWRESEVTINARQDAGTVYVVYQTGWTKTGTPGDLYVAHSITYRIVAT